MRGITQGAAFIAVAASLALTLGGCGGGGNTTDTSTPDTATSSGAPTTTPQTPAPPEAPGAPLNTFGDGNYIVPKDVAVGTYHTDGPAKPGLDCYWQRDGADGMPAVNHLSRDPQTVSVAATDTAFHSVGCKPWARVS